MGNDKRCPWCNGRLDRKGYCRTCGKQAPKA